MRDTWVLVADAGRARVYLADPTLSAFELVTAMDHPASRRHASELVTDHRGRAHSSPFGPASAMDGRTDPLEAAHADFAREVAAYLHEGIDRYNSLVIAAPPRFLGLLRHAVTSAVSSRITRTVNRDFTLAHAEELPSLFRAHAAG